MQTIQVVGSGGNNNFNRKKSKVGLNSNISNSGGASNQGNSQNGPSSGSNNHKKLPNKSQTLQWN